ncbi:MAG: protein-export chaperone SecB [Rhodobacteraceae bacterium]|nr:protein-export chaperone SecB [Paracoccaceae bacterium]
MTEEKTAQPIQPRMYILGQFIRDLSFENIAAQKQILIRSQPDIQVQAALDTRKRDAANQYDVIVKLNIKSTTKGDQPQTVLILELDYVGIFRVENVPNEQLHPLLMIEGPRMLFPFMRRIIWDITRDGGVPQVNLENIDFLAMYRNEMARRAQEKKASDT